MNKYLTIFMMMAVIVLIAGCNKDNGESSEDSDKPTMELTLNKHSITVASGSFSEVITLTLIKTDSKNIPSSFVIELISPEKEFIHFVDKDNNPLDTINTTLFEHEGDQKLYDFKIYAKKNPQKDYVGYTLDFKLWYNREEIGIMPKLKVRVT